MMLSSAKRLYRNGSTSSRVSGPPRLSSRTPTFSSGGSRTAAAPLPASSALLPRVSLASLKRQMEAVAQSSQARSNAI